MNERQVKKGTQLLLRYYSGDIDIEEVVTESVRLGLTSKQLGRLQKDNNVIERVAKTWKRRS